MISEYEDVPELVANFLKYMTTIKNRSENTIKEYYYDLRLLFRFLKVYKSGKDPLKENIDLELIDITDLDIDFFKSIDTEDFYTYLNFLNNEYKLKTGKILKPTSRARKTASIKSFYNYLAVNLKLLKINPTIGLDTPQLDKRMPKYLNLEEAEALLHSVKFNEQKYGRRDYAILTIFLNCGLRLAELVNINYKDIKNEMLSVIGKGNKERQIHLNNACMKAIDDYIAVKPKDVIDRNALFLSDRGTRISRRMVETIVKKYLKLAGLDETKFSTHKLRHTAATLMHKYGNADIRTLQQVLGHETIATTQIYTHIDSEEVKEAIDNNPLNYINE